MAPITENSIAFWDNVIAEATWLTVTDAVVLYNPEEALIVAVPLPTEVTVFVLLRLPQTVCERVIMSGRSDPE